MQSGQVPHRAILIGGFTRLGRYGQRDSPDGILRKTRGRHRGIVPKGPRPRRGSGDRQGSARGSNLSGRTHGGKGPHDTDGGGYLEFGLQPDTVPETNTASESGGQPPSTEGGAPVPPATSAQPEVPDILLAALKNASIVEEHCALMGAVIEKIQSAESGLNEACISLITALRYVS